MTPQTANQINTPQVGQVETVSGESPAAAYQLVAQVTKLKSQLEAAQAKCAEMREALDELTGMACEFIGPDEDGKPECVCCHMELETCSKGHRQDCLAQAILDRSHALSTDCGKDYFSREQIRPLRDALLGIVEWVESAEKEWLESVDITAPKELAQQALAHAKQLGL